MPGFGCLIFVAQSFSNRAMKTCEARSTAAPAWQHGMVLGPHHPKRLCGAPGRRQRRRPKRLDAAKQRPRVPFVTGLLDGGHGLGLNLGPGLSILTIVQPPPCSQFHNFFLAIDAPSRSQRNLARVACGGTLPPGPQSVPAMTFSRV